MKKVKSKTVPILTYFVDPKREELGKFYVDKDGREIFSNDRGESYYFGSIDGNVHRIIIYPLQPPPLRMPADPGTGLSLGNGGVKEGGGFSSG